jgi:hypothetical protein
LSTVTYRPSLSSRENHFLITGAANAEIVAVHGPTGENEIEYR